MTSTRRFMQFASATVAASVLMFATAAFAGDTAKTPKPNGDLQLTDPVDHMLFGGTNSGRRCAVANPSPLPQGSQQIQVCNNWTGAAGSNNELFNTTGQSCSVTAGTTTWPFVQSAPINIPNSNGTWVTLITSLTPGDTYNYSVNCCPGGGGQEIHTVTVK